jgi:hypothetical protein
MLAAAFATVALLPGLLTPTVDQVKTETPLPLRVPSSVPSDYEALYPYGGGREREYALGLSAAPDCGGAGACFVAAFSAHRGGKPHGPRKATLARGIRGRYKPLSCGASCAPPTIEWKQRGVVYRIEANVGTKHTERRLMVRMANEAIRQGPR